MTKKCDCCEKECSKEEVEKGQLFEDETGSVFMCERCWDSSQSVETLIDVDL